MANKEPKLFEFTVQSYDEFPLDMLRYDRCWPKRESEDVISIKRSMDVRWRRLHNGPFQVTLVGYKQPTAARWQSFGWIVV